MRLPGSGSPRGADDFDALVLDSRARLFALAMRYTHDRAAAEDLVQDTVVRALRFRDRFEPGTNFRAWVCTILAHTFIHRYRRQQRERDLLSGEHRADVGRALHSEAARSLALHPEEALLEGHLSDEVSAAVDGLPADFREALIHCDLEGCTYRDAATLLACPVGTVMSRLYRARRMLEEKLIGVAVERGILRASNTPPPASGPAPREVASVKRRKAG